MRVNTKANGYRRGRGLTSVVLKALSPEGDNDGIGFEGRFTILLGQLTWPLQN